jgi:hypothetical protein
MVTNPIDEFRKTLAGNKGATQLLEDLCSHFGSDLRFEVQDAKIEWSGVSYPYKPMPPFCEIVVTSHLRPGAIVHELLHVKMYKNGFPVPIVDFGIGFSEALALTNAVSHPLFIEEFSAFGFKKTDFFFGDEFKNLAEIEDALHDALEDPASVAFLRGRWNRSWLAQWVADQMDLPNKEKQFMKIGKKKFAEMDADAAWCKSWFYRGDFRSAAKHADAITQFMTHFGLPVTRFAKLEPIGNQIRLA